MEAMVNKTLVRLAKGDITKQTTDAIVNAANSGLMGGGGVDGAIHHAGGPAIVEECRGIVARQGRLPTGKAVITTGGALAARYVIHTVGPVWHGGNHNEAELLESAYSESLRLATVHGLSSIAFPSISTGAYGYPVDKASQIALHTVFSFVQTHTTTLRDVAFVLFDTGTYESYRSALAHVTTA